MSRNRIFVISGASGVGKSTVLKEVMARRPGLSFSVSATTRAPRPDEQEGVHYYFVTREKFAEMIARDEFLEYDEHTQTCYGTPRHQVEEKLKRGHVLLDIEPNGAFQVRAKYPDAVLIFIMPPSVEELEHRLRGRKNTSEEQMRLRLERARWEMAQRDKYDHVVVNDQVETCAQTLLHIIEQSENE